MKTVGASTVRRGDVSQAKPAIAALPLKKWGSWGVGSRGDLFTGFSPSLPLSLSSLLPRAVEYVKKYYVKNIHN